ncbi:MAG: hypothetical protein ACOC7L_03790, partial [Acidobacteriota bacterium]
MEQGVAQLVSGGELPQRLRLVGGDGEDPGAEAFQLFQVQLQLDQLRAAERSPGAAEEDQDHRGLSAELAQRVFG